MLRSVTSLLILCAGFLQLGCGTKDKTEDVNVNHLEFENNAKVLHKGTSLKVKGSVEGNKPFTVSFKLTDANGKKFAQNEDTLHVTHQNPPSGKLSLTLHNDMGTRVNAGMDVCNGSYVLHVIAQVGNAEVSKPLPFTVEGGRDPSECQTTDTTKKSDDTSKTPNVKFGTIHNIQGLQPGAYDLVNGQSKTIHDSDSDKDLRDMTVTGKTAMSLRFESPNDATIAYVPNLDFDTATHDSALNAFNNSAQRKETEILKDNDVFVVRLNNQRNNQLYLLKILSARGNSHAHGHHKNDGAVSFKYRKL